MKPGDKVRLKHTLVFPDGGRICSGEIITLNGCRETSAGRRWLVLRDGQWFSNLTADDFEELPT